MNRKIFLIVISSFFLFALTYLGVNLFHSSQKSVSSGDVDIRENEQWELVRLRDPKTGQIPEHIRANELQFATTLPGSFNSIRNSKKSYLLANKWDARGPSNIGGRTRAIAKDILDKNVILAGGVSGGMWRSTNDGSTWTPVTRPDQLHSSTCIAQDIRKGKENTWYFGTGELRGSSSQSSGDGIFKSTDGGNTWTLLSSTSTQKPNSWDNAFDYVWNICVNHTNPNQDEVFAATAMGAIMRSTDGGATWNATLGGLGPNRSYFTDVAISPNGILYAALSSFAAGNVCISKGIYRSTDGVNWTDITPDNWAPNTWRITIGIAPSDENQVYFLAETPKYGKLTRDLYRDSMFHSLWKYTYLRDEGKGANGIWEDRSQNLPAPPTDWRGQYNSQESYNMAIKVKPDDPNVVFIAGTNLYRSENGFATDTKTYWIGGYMSGIVGSYKEYTNHHPDVHTILFDYTDPNVIYTGTDGGIHKTLNCMKQDIEWVSLNNTYITTQFYSVSLNHFEVTDYSVIGGMQDNCTYLTNSMELKDTWLRLLDSDGFCCVTGGKNIYYVSKNGIWQPKIKIYRVKTDDNGNVLTTTRIDPSLGKDFIWNTPFTLDPNNPDKMYVAGGKVIWRNNRISTIPFVDSKDSTMVGWDSLTTTVIPTGSISAVRISKYPANIMVYGTTEGKLYKATDCDKGDPIVVNITGTNFPASANISGIAFDPSDAQKIMVCFSNYNVLSIFWTTDGGSDWTPVSGNLEEYPGGSGSGPAVNWIEIMPVKGQNMFFAGTSTGLYATCSVDGMNTVWVQEGAETIGNSIVDMVDTRSDDGYVVAGTHGCGVFSAKITSLYSAPSKPSLLSPVDNTKGQLNDIQLSWNSVSSAVFYTVQVSTDVDFKNVIWQNDGVKTTNTTFSVPTDGLIDYYWRVFAKNAGGWSQPSQIWTFRSAIGPPTLSFPDNGAINIPQSVSLKWLRNPFATKYHVLAASNISFSKKVVDTILASDTMFALINLEQNKKYYWKVSSIDENAEGLMSETYNFRTVNLGSVGDYYYQKSGLIKNIFPNPCSNLLCVRIEPALTGQVSIRLYNLKGEMIKILTDGTLFSGAYEISADVNDLPAGSYYIEVKSSGMYDVKQIIISR